MVGTISVVGARGRAGGGGGKNQYEWEACFFGGELNEVQLRGSIGTMRNKQAEGDQDGGVESGAWSGESAGSLGPGAG